MLEVRNNKIYEVSSKVQVSKRKLIKMYLIFKLMEKGIEALFSNNEVDVLVNLFMFGGTSGKDSLKQFLESCYSLNLSKKGSTSILNLFTKARFNGILIRKSSSNWQISRDFIADDMYTHPYFVFRGALTNLGHAEQQ